MLEALTGGLFVSNPHRVRHPGIEKSRFSFPFFFDPSMDCVIKRIPLKGDLLYEAEASVLQRRRNDYRRWDGCVEVRPAGTYGEYLTSKVSKVFPTLATQVL
jgi:hypothetical protein